MSKKLYVGGLSYQTSQDTLRDFFSKAGTVSSATVITDRVSGRSKGFGFVEMLTEEEAQEAISQFNGQELEGRQITVNEARPQEPKSNRKGFSTEGRGRGRGNQGNGGHRKNYW